MSDETRGVKEDKNNTVDRTNGPESNIVRIWKAIVTPALQALCNNDAKIRVKTKEKLNECVSSSKQKI